MKNQNLPVIGFVGLGVMGAPMCRNMATKYQGRVIAFDANSSSYDGLEELVEVSASLMELSDLADIVFLSLPSGIVVEAVCLGAQGLSSAKQLPRLIVDLSTTTVASARHVAAKLSEMGVGFADAPVARTREAAQRGELSIMVGASDAVFTEIEPLLRHIASDITHCGEVGCGQVVKLANNALVFENTMALAEMMVMGQRAGVTPEKLLEAVSKGSGDSFVLRNHGVKAMLPRHFSEKSFSPEYVLKDIDCVLDLARDVGLQAHVTQLARQYYGATADSEYANRYFPAVIEIIDRGAALADAATSDLRKD